MGGTAHGMNRVRAQVYRAVGLRIFQFAPQKFVVVSPPGALQPDLMFVLPHASSFDDDIFPLPRTLPRFAAVLPAVLLAAVPPLSCTAFLSLSLSLSLSRSPVVLVTSAPRVCTPPLTRGVCPGIG